MSAGDYVPFDIGSPVFERVSPLEQIDPVTTQKAQFSAENPCESVAAVTAPTLASSRNALADDGFFPDYGKGEDFRAFQRDPGKTLATLATIAGSKADRPWREGLERLLKLTRPNYVTKDRWEEICFDAARLDGQWGSAAAEFGWSIEEMYGINRRPWKMGVDAWGVCPLLQGRPVVSLTRETACIDVGRGHIQTFRRAYGLSNSIPMWDAYACGPDP